MKEENQVRNEEKEGDLPGCSCSANPFSSLPPDQQPKNKSWKSAFKKVTCRGCERDFWTNSEYIYCHECRKEGR